MLVLHFPWSCGSNWCQFGWMAWVPVSWWFSISAYFFFRLSNSASCRLLPMMSFFFHRYFGCSWTEWDGQYLSWEEVYCPTTALVGYPSHPDKIHDIHMATSVYICSTAFYEH